MLDCHADIDDDADDDDDAYNYHDLIPPSATYYHLLPPCTTYFGPAWAWGSGVVWGKGKVWGCLGQGHSRTTVGRFGRSGGQSRTSVGVTVGRTDNSLFGLAPSRRCSVPWGCQRLCQRAEFPAP